MIGGLAQEFFSYKLLAYEVKKVQVLSDIWSAEDRV